MRSKFFTPYWLPVWFFFVGIVAGTVLLRLPVCRMDPAVPMPLLDAIFTATSAMCVTGLGVVDTGSYFTASGQGVILGLFQLGGLGIMTYTSLVFYLFGRKVSLADRLAVGQTLLHDPAFSLKRFVAMVIGLTLGLELAGAVLLYLLDPAGFGPWSALFHSVSAFCNAGFSLFPDSLAQWRAHWGVNVVFMALIVLGGLGFAVLMELGSVFRRIARGHRRFTAHRFSLHTRVVLSMTALLILGGWGAIFLAEYFGGVGDHPWNEQLLSSLFQSVTCRTAGFSTVQLGHMTNVTLLFMVMLMFIGGSPGSTAGGIKTTTARALFGYVISQFKGCDQVRAGGQALTPSTRSKAITLVVFALLLVALAILLLEVTEGGDVPHHLARGQFLETVFEAVSAFGTVGLSTGMTERLGGAGKWVVIVMMFVGRLGPVWLLTALQSWQEERRYRIPEVDLPLG